MPKKLRLFEYVVILQPEFDKDGQMSEEGRVLVERTDVLTETDAQAGMIAARSIPENYMSKLDRVEVVLRPF